MLDALLSRKHGDLNALPPFIASMEEEQDCRIVRLKGNLGREVIPSVTDYLKARKSQGGDRIQKHLILDCSMVCHVDSSTVACLATRMREYLERHYEIALVQISDEFDAYLRIACLRHVFQNYESVEQARQGLSHED